MPIFCPNTRAVAIAMEANAPRPIKECILERFPDAVIDKNNRAHAPCDGYIDEFTGKAYRGGEYLPFEPEDDDFFNMKGGSKRHIVSLFDGQELVIFEGSKKQCQAGRNAAKEEMRKVDSNNQFVGQLKKRSTFTVRLMNVFINTEGYYGIQYTHYFRDMEGNNIVWQGSTPLFKKNDGSIERYSELTPFEIVATVKSHWNSKYDERSATYLTRVTLKGNK